MMTRTTTAALTLAALLAAGCASSSGRPAAAASSFLDSPAGHRAVAAAHARVKYCAGVNPAGKPPAIPGVASPQPVSESYLAQHPIKGGRKWVACFAPAGSGHKILSCALHSGATLGHGALSRDETILARCDVQVTR